MKPQSNSRDEKLSPPTNPQDVAVNPTQDLQSLLDDINNILLQASGRLPWQIPTEAIKQRRVLERVRDYLADQQANQQTDRDSSPPLDPRIQQIITQQVRQEIQELQAIQGQSANAEGAYLENWGRSPLDNPVNPPSPAVATNPAPPLNSDNPLGQLILPNPSKLGAGTVSSSRLSSSFSSGQQQEIMGSFGVMMQELQENLHQQMQQAFIQINNQFAQLRDSTSDPEFSEVARQPGTLTAEERWEKMQLLQQKSDQLLLTIDSNQRIIFATLQRHLQTYQQSLTEKLAGMYQLGMQTEVVFSSLVQQLVQQMELELAARQQAASQILAGQVANPETVSSPPSTPEVDNSLIDLSLNQSPTALRFSPTPTSPEINLVPKAETESELDWDLIDTIPPEAGVDALIIIDIADQSNLLESAPEDIDGILASLTTSPDIAGESQPELSESPELVETQADPQAGEELYASLFSTELSEQEEDYLESLLFGDTIPDPEPEESPELVTALEDGDEVSWEMALFATESPPEEETIDVEMPSIAVEVIHHLTDLIDPALLPPRADNLLVGDLAIEGEGEEIDLELDWDLGPESGVDRYIVASPEESLLVPSESPDLEARAITLEQELLAQLEQDLDDFETGIAPSITEDIPTIEIANIEIPNTDISSISESYLPESETPISDELLAEDWQQLSPELPEDSLDLLRAESEDLSSENPPEPSFLDLSLEDASALIQDSPALPVEDFLETLDAQELGTDLQGLDAQELATENPPELLDSQELDPQELVGDLQESNAQELTLSPENTPEISDLSLEDFQELSASENLSIENEHNSLLTTEEENLSFILDTSSEIPRENDLFVDQELSLDLVAQSDEISEVAIIDNGINAETIESSLEIFPELNEVVEVAEIDQESSLESFSGLKEMVLDNPNQNSDQYLNRDVDRTESILDLPLEELGTEQERSQQNNQNNQDNENSIDMLGLDAEELALLANMPLDNVPESESALIAHLLIDEAIDQDLDHNLRANPEVGQYTNEIPRLDPQDPELIDLLSIESFDNSDLDEDMEELFLGEVDEFPSLGLGLSPKKILRSEEDTLTEIPIDEDETRDEIDYRNTVASEVSDRPPSPETTLNNSLFDDRELLVETEANIETNYPLNLDESELMEMVWNQILDRSNPEEPESGEYSSQEVIDFELQDALGEGENLPGLGSNFNNAGASYLIQSSNLETLGENLGTTPPDGQNDTSIEPISRPQPVDPSHYTLPEAAPIPSTALNSDTWYLGVDFGTTGVAAVLLNQTTGELYPLHWQQHHESLPIITNYRLPTGVYGIPDAAIPKGETYANEQETTAMYAVGLGVPENLEPGQVLCQNFKPYLDLGIPTWLGSSWQPILRLAQNQPLVSIHYLQQAAQTVFSTLNPEVALARKLGAKGIEAEVMANILGSISGVVVNCPVVSCDAYRWNVREAVLAAQLVTQPEQVIFVEEAIAPFLATRQIRNHQGPQPTPFPWRGYTLVINSGATVTEFAIVDTTQNYKFTHSDFGLWSFPYAGNALDQDIICQLLLSSETKLLQTIYETDKLLLTNDLELPQPGELDTARRERLHFWLQSSAWGQTLLIAAQNLKLHLQTKTEHRLSLGTDQWLVQQAQYESKVVIPFLQQMNQQLNSFLSATGVSEHGIYQVICAGGTVSGSLLQEWLKIKLPQAVAIENIGIPSEMMAAAGLASLPLDPQICSQAQQYGDYFLVMELLRILPLETAETPAPTYSRSEINQLLERRGINTRACSDRLEALLRGELPAGLIPQLNNQNIWLAATSQRHPEYLALQAEPIFTQLTQDQQLLYQPNLPQCRRLYQYMETMLARTKQKLEEPLIFDLGGS
ncbi:MAG: hypothetical protein HC916_04840 [Coleofasciculaceae cyanobacterium SM2_1_6]|nr:hypothetical protein [Coleofasciculaceae cyanobacterium SM2_1_6]